MDQTPLNTPTPDTMATTEIADRASEIENFRGPRPAGKLNFDKLGGETNSNSTATAQHKQPTQAAEQQQGDDADADDDEHTPTRPTARLTDLQKHLRQASTAKKKAIRDKRRSCDVHMMAISEDDDRPGRNYADRQPGDRPAVGDGDGPGHDDDDSDDDDGYRPAGKSGDRPRRNYTDSDDDDDGSEISFQGEPDMNDIINSLTDTNKQRDIVTGAKDAVLDLIDLNKLAAEWRKVEKNYSNSLEQAATFMRAGSTTSGKKHQFDIMREALKRGGSTAQTEVQNTLKYLRRSHKWQPTESIGMVAYLMTSDEENESEKTISHTIEMFCMLGLPGLKTFRRLTESRRLDVDLIGTSTDLRTTPGYDWLDPNSESGVHHAHGWSELLKGTLHMVCQKTKFMRTCTEAIQKWVCKGNSFTLLGKTIDGKAQRQLRKSRHSRLINNEMMTWKDMVETLDFYDMQSETPSPAARVANMVMRLDDSKVKHIQKMLRRWKPRPIAMEKATYKQITDILYDDEERREPEYWVNDDEASDRYNRDREPRDRDREQRPKREKFERKPGQKKLTKEEYAALVIYANEKGIDRKSVTDVEAALKAGGKSVQYWLDRKKTDGGPRSHHAGQPEKSNRDEEKEDKDDGISNQKLKELGRPRECPFHKKGNCKKGD